MKRRCESQSEGYECATGEPVDHILVAPDGSQQHVCRTHAWRIVELCEHEHLRILSLETP